MAALFRISYKEKTDEELMLMVQEKIPAAMEELYNRYSKRMLGFFYQMLNKDEARAQDFLHDLFIKCIEKAWLFDSTRKFSTWLYAIATNMCRNEYRLRAGQHTISKDTLRDVADEEFNIFISTADDSALREQIDRSVLLLEPIHREVFLLRFVEDLKIGEISDILEIPEGTVKSRIFHCLKKMQLCLVEFNPKI